VTPASRIAGASCGNHPGLAAVEICTRCGTFLCGDCVEYFKEETPSCANCLPLMKGGPASVRAKISPLLSALGLASLFAGFLVRGRPGLAIWGLGFLVGFSGLAFGVQELRLIKANQAGSRGRNWARTGLVIGALFALGFGALAASFALFTWRAAGTPP
jgi:hypothetical protein